MLVINVPLVSTGYSRYYLDSDISVVDTDSLNKSSLTKQYMWTINKL